MDFLGIANIKRKFGRLAFDIIYRMCRMTYIFPPNIYNAWIIASNIFMNLTQPCRKFWFLANGWKGHNKVETIIADSDVFLIPKFLEKSKCSMAIAVTWAASVMPPRCPWAVREKWNHFRHLGTRNLIDTLQTGTRVYTLVRYVFVYHHH